MYGKRAGTLVVLIMLAAMTFGLGGCRKTDTSTTGTPQSPVTSGKKVTLPVVGSDASPLPTPGTDSSPLQP